MLDKMHSGRRIPIACDLHLANYPVAWSLSAVCHVDIDHFVLLIIYSIACRWFEVDSRESAQQQDLSVFVGTFFRSDASLRNSIGAH